MRYVGLDVGYGYTKVLTGAEDGIRSLVFPSIVSPAVEILFRSGLENPYNRLDHLIITLDGTDYFVGDLALRQGRFARSTLDRVRTQTQEYKALFLSALALLADPSGEDFSIVTGLPVDDFDDRILIVDNLTGRFRFYLGRREVSLSIQNLMVVPQPYGALMDLIFEDTQGNMDEKYAEGRVGIIDIGFKTTDFVLIRCGEFIQKASGSLKKGMNLVYQAAVPKFTAHYPGNWNLHHVEAALREGGFSSLGKRFTVDPGILNSDLAGLAEEIGTWIQGQWGAEAVDYLICSGGGSLILKPYLTSLFPQILFMDNPQEANVRGFYKGASYYYG